MKPSRKKVVPKKKRGRPATGRDPVRQLRMSEEQAAAVTAWAKNQEDKPNWSEAARRLIDHGLAASQPLKKRSEASASEARAMARRAVDQVSDPSLPVEEREKRRRRLTRGPQEFRAMRDDLPKPKG